MGKVVQKPGRLLTDSPFLLLFRKSLMGDLEVKIFNTICSVIVIFTAAAFILTLSQNIVFRSPEVYSFYFNDSRAVGKIHTTLTSGEMSDEIVSFINSWRPEKFEILEDTGYDMESIFTDEESVNMMAVKRVMDMSGIILIVSLIVTVAIYVHFLRLGRKKVLSDMFKVTIALVIAGIIAEIWFMATNGGRIMVMAALNMVSLKEDSQLTILLGADFLNIATMFLVVLTIIVLAVCAYVNRILTKPPRIFY